MTDDIYKKLSEERKKQQELGLLPSWYSTGGWQLFKQKYLYEAKSWKEQIERICRTAAKHTDNPSMWEPKFFQLFWNGWLSPSTPVLANMGTNRGLPISCSGQYIPDSVAGFYTSLAETAVLSQEGFGTSGYLGAIRPRGSKISRGGKASGVLPVLKMFVQSTRDVSQGSTRRGAWAGYLPIDHGDFWEIAAYILANPDDLNIGWLVSDNFLDLLKAEDEDAVARWQEVLYIKQTLGKGYFQFSDRCNRHRPESYVINNLDIKASNLCTEIMLHSSEEYTYTCCLSSMNVALYDEWKDTDAVFSATVFLDCVVAEFIERASTIPLLEKAVNFTRNGRALGLGQMGLFSLFQKRRIAPDGFEAHMLNNEIARTIREKAEEATKWMAQQWGEPLWCKGLGRRNTHLIAIAPTKSTALLMGGWSEGINPDPAMVFSASGAAGDIDRMNPVLLALIKEKGLDLKKCTDDILKNGGSVQGESIGWLTDEEKSWFLTAFEIDQKVLVRYASARQRYVDQGQSTNLFFAHNDTEEYISEVTSTAFLDENILSLYYVYSSAEIKAERTGECSACQ